MAENLTTTTQVDPAVSTFYDRVLLVRALPFLVHDKFAQRRNIPSRSGNIIKFRRYTSLSVAKTPLTEGQTPPGSQLAKTDLTATISWYGDYVHITDVVDLTVEDPVLTETSELLGEQMGETLDEIVRDILAACASSTNASRGSSTDTPKEITKGDIDAVVKTMLNNNAKMITSVVTASGGVGTTPVRPSFMGIISTAQVDDLEAVTGFKSTAEYPSQKGVMEAEWGNTGNVRWLMTSKGYSVASASTLSATVYYDMIFGQNAYGITELTAATAKTIVKEFGSGGTSDPLNQRATMGWKTAFTSRILNDNFMHILKCVHS